MRNYTAPCCRPRAKRLVLSDQQQGAPASLCAPTRYDLDFWIQLKERFQAIAELLFDLFLAAL